MSNGNVFGSSSLVLNAIYTNRDAMEDLKRGLAELEAGSVPAPAGGVV